MQRNIRYTMNSKAAFIDLLCTAQKASASFSTWTTRNLSISVG